MADDQALVLVGGGLAAARAAEEIRNRGHDGPVILIGAEDEAPYERPVLSKGYLLGSEERDSAFVYDRQWYADHGIELRLGTPVSAIDRAAKQVVVGGERVGYQRLLLATGSQPRTLPVPGAELTGVHTLRNMGDAEAIKAAIGRGGSMVVVGGGWIGLEVAAAAQQQGVDVTVLIRDELPLVGVLGQQVAQVFADLHREHGVRLLTQTEASSFTGSDGAIAAVVTSDGQSLQANSVVVGIGAEPRLDLARSAGLETDGGVLVDASLRSSDPDIFAAGDIAEVDHPLLHRRVRVEHWANAQDGGPIAGAGLAGHAAQLESLPYFFTDQYDLGMEYIGLADPSEVDSVELRGDVAGRAFRAFWVGNGKVLAGMHVNLWDDGIDPIKEVVSSGDVGKIF